MNAPRCFRTLLLLSLCAVPSSVRAEQFVLFDVTFTYTKQDADNSRPSKSHYYVKADRLNPNRPRDWTAPVDYRNGTVHIRAEVLEKPPGGTPTTWTICYIPNKGKGNGYGCTGTQIYREKGVYEKDVSMKAFWQNDAIVWTEGIKQMDLVIKDDSGGQGHAHKRQDSEKFFPTKMRMTLVQVSAGSKYDPSLVPNLQRVSDEGGEGEADPSRRIDRRIDEPRYALRVGSTEASASLLARVGVVGRMAQALAQSIVAQRFGAREGRVFRGLDPSMITYLWRGSHETLGRSMEPGEPGPRSLEARFSQL
jgi:hypothetical protein